ncbi:hypothetical protein H9P43_001456 [Blastocladiella emersonii ATCC 22665]|nr:hypothetical protein H9P43_001456 [Blastocladiella emersonii ATCC 22665]
MPAAQTSTSKPGTAPTIPKTGPPAVDYYQVLGLPRSAELHDIQSAFRRLALQHHPDRKKGTDPAEFARICEAFDVLHRLETRAVYDLFGREGLENGFPAQSDKPGFPGYKYHGDSNKTFRDYFGGDNVFHEVFKEHLYDIQTGVQRVGYGSIRPEIVKQPPIEKPLHITLEEAYVGITKKVAWARTVLESGEASDRQATKTDTLPLIVAPGTKHGTRLVFPEHGDQAPHTIAADVVFIVHVDPHPTYTRDGSDNLVYTHKVTLQEALTGSAVILKALDGRQLNIPIYEVVSPFYVKRVEGEGMPIVEKPEVLAEDPSRRRKGDLLIRFQVEFPTYLSPKQKKLIQEALGGNSPAS